MQGKKAFWLVVVLLVVPAAGMTVFAWRMVGGVRANAARTDARMRELAAPVARFGMQIRRPARKDDAPASEFRVTGATRA